MAIIDFGNKYSDKPLMIMLIGIPGSGKSFVAEQMAKAYNAVICSSDQKRKELYGDENTQGDPKEVFINLHKDILHLLRIGKNVIYDATNIRRKNRESFLQFLKQNKIECYRIAWVVATPMEDCIARDANRERHVGKEIIQRMLCSFDFPQYFEGWNEILIWDYENTLPMPEMPYRSALQDLMNDYDQKNPWHWETVGKHCLRVQSFVWELYQKNSENYLHEFYHLPVQVAAHYHDVGKLFTQTFDDKGIAHYYGHANMSTYYMASHLELFPADITIEEVYFALFLINYHMLPYSLQTDEARTKWAKKFGLYWFDALMLLHQADMMSTSEEVRNANLAVCG